MPAPDGRLHARPGPGAGGPPLPPGTTVFRPGGRGEARVAVPSGGPVPRPLLVFCHGAGGDAAQGLAAVGDVATARGVAVLATSSAGRTWDLLTGGLGPDVAVLDDALREVAAGLAVSRLALGGFSDGASYALSLGLANGDLFEALLAFSPGFAAPPGRTGRPRVWLAHGTADRVLPVERCGRRVARALTAAGHDVVYDEFDGGHVVTPALVTEALDTWLR